MSGRPLYVDLTDVVWFLVSSPRVSGIQRVQLNLLGPVLQRHPQREIHGLFVHPFTRQLYRFRPHGIVEGSAQGGLLPRRLGVTRPWMPDLHHLWRVLRPYEDRRIERRLRMLALLLAARLAPGRLEGLGLPRPGQAERAVPMAPLTRVTRLPREARLVLLGSSWSLPKVEPLARQHARRGGEVVQLIYDLIPIMAPHLFQEPLRSRFQAWLERISRYTRRYLCISEHTAADLRRYLEGRGLQADVQVVPLAHELQGFDRTAPAPMPPGGPAEEAAGAPYVLCVGTLEVRKNGAALLEAWSALDAELGPRLPRLVFAGRMGWMMEEFEARLARDPALARTVRVVESPTDAELAALYQRCLFTVFPSLYEGWGLPVGEAAWFGKYTLSSHTSSLPEVCGDLVDYVDPQDPAALRQALRHALTHPEEIQARARRIAAAPLRTWADAAEDLYQKLEHPHPPKTGTREAHP